MKTIRHMILGLMLAMSGTALADDYAYLTIDQNGSESSYAVSEIAKITFDAENMVVHLTDGSQNRLPLTALSKMFFADSTTGVATTGAQRSQVSLKDGVLRVSGERGSVITVYDVAGKAVRSVTATAAETEIHLNGVAKGVYIVKVGNSARKIMNR